MENRATLEKKLRGYRASRAEALQQIEALEARREEQLERYSHNSTAQQTILNDDSVNTQVRDLRQKVEAIDTVIHTIEQQLSQS